MASGRSLLWISPGSDNREPRIFMSALVDPHRPAQDLIAGEINQDYLWSLTNSRILPAYIAPCVTDLSASALMCSFAAESLPEILKHEIQYAALGDFEWSAQGQQFFASYWTVPTKFEFHWPGLAVVLRTSKEGVFASIAEVETTFLLWVTACLGASILMASYQIRTRLVPVEKLQEATQRIAAEDFAFRTKVASGDEFEELAGSINAMAAQLGRQFRTLSTKAAIDRAVLSLLDTSKITATILTRIMSLLTCDRGTMTLFDTEKSAPPKTFRVDKLPPRLATIGDDEGDVSGPGDIEGSARPEVWQNGDLEPVDDPDPIAVRGMIETTTELSSGTDSGLENAEASHLQRSGFKAWLSMPLCINGEILCTMVFYSKEKREFTDDEIAFVKNFTGQAAIAIYNSRLFEQTKQQAAELLKANQAKDDFLSVVSHELRTPLNVVLGYVRVLQDKMLGELNADQEKALSTVNRHSVDLLGIVDSIMDATKIETGAVVIENRPVDLFNFFENLKCESSVPADKQIAVNWSDPAALPTVVTDEAKLRTIVRHLISNAVKFTERGAVTITASQPTDHSIEITVTDTGVGIPAASLQRIFSLFEQSDNSKTREYGGMGLGLFIVQKFTALLGGKIVVESKEGVGSTFTLTLPLVPAQYDAGQSYDASKYLGATGLTPEL